MARKIANIYRRDDGTYQLRFTVDGKRYAVYGRTVDECRQKESQKRQEIEEGAYQRQKDITLGEYCRRWLSGKRGTVKDSTILAYVTQINGMLSLPIADVRLKDLRPQHIRDMIGAMQGALQPTSINLRIVTLKQILKSAVQEDLIVKSPADGIKALRAPKRPSDSAPHRALTKEETAALLQAADARGDLYRDLYRLMLHTGLRIGEAIALVDSDIVGERLHCARTIMRSSAGTVIGDSPKSSAGDRIIPLDREAQEAIRRSQELRSAMGWDTDRIFSSSVGTMANPQEINAQLRKTCLAAGIEPITSHALRDSFATRCAESRMQPRVLMEIMGHASISMTMEVYVHALDEVKSAELAAVDFGT